ncbi:hypothetical protein ACFQY5_08415 [Paeniroseomonas aquatica]|uniref:hypothetical protein n=1 Tax=Paeniroseomonas aquatica TaxID=373043 RepID=UPI00361CF0DA
MTLLLCATVLIAAAVLRSTEYDENYSVFVTGGTARPEWPEASFVPNDVRDYFLVHATFNEIIDNLLKTDVHPPLYFLALGSWRHLAGNGLFSLRMLSVIFGFLPYLSGC